MTFGTTGSIFAGIEDAPELGEGRRYFEEEGEYVVTLAEATQGRSKNPKRKNQPFAAHSLVIDKVLVDGMAKDDLTQEDVDALKARDADVPLTPGTKVSWVKYLINEWAFRDVKNLIASVIGCPQSAVTEDVAAEFYEKDGAAVTGTQFKVKVKKRVADDGRVFHNIYCSQLGA